MPIAVAATAVAMVVVVVVANSRNLRARDKVLPPHVPGAAIAHRAPKCQTRSDLHCTPNIHVGRSCQRAGPHCPSSSARKHGSCASPVLLAISHHPVLPSPTSGCKPQAEGATVLRQV